MQPLYARLWGNGFLPYIHQGVQFRGGKEPVLYMTNPPGVKAKDRRRFLDKLQRLNQMQLEEFGNPELSTRIAQYERAYRMQTSVPETMDVSDEPEHTTIFMALILVFPELLQLIASSHVDW